MGLIKWSGKFSVHVQEIDEQHRVMIGMINDLHDGMIAGQAAETLEKTFQGLLQYIRFHFSNEEQYFRRFGYEEAEAHTADHNAFILKIGEFWNEYHDGNPTVAIRLMNFLNDWVRLHIMKIDKRYVPLFKSRGL